MYAGCRLTHIQGETQKQINLQSGNMENLEMQNVVDMPENQEGVAEEEENYVAAYIIADLMADELSFNNPIYQEIYETYKTKLLEGEIIDSNYFFALNREDIGSVVASLLAINYMVSDNWKQRFQIYVPTWEDNLEKDVSQSILRFKQQRLDERIKQLMEQLKQPHSDDDMILVLNDLNNLKKIRVMIARELNQIITNS
jgi:DNA primase